MNPANGNNLISRAQVDEAWQLRIDGKIDPSMALFSQMRKALPCLQERLDQAQLTKLLRLGEPDLYLDIVLLQASLTRAQKRAEEHERLLNLIEGEVLEQSLPRPFWVVFERAITAYRKGDFSSALDGFGLAFDKARNDFEKLLSRINFACCLYSLGQSFQHALEDCDSLMRELEGGHSRTHLGTIIEQKTALELFHHFRQGEVHRVLTKKTPQGSPSHFLQAWCTQLPFHRYYQKSQLNEDTFSFNATTCLEPAYRQRTLLGLVHPSDDQPPRLSDWADRLYLWVWRWLVDPEAFAIEKVLKTLTPLKQSSQLYLLSVEDRKLIRNALLWLGLFDSSSKRLLQSLLKLVEVSEITSYPLLEGERLLIHYWMSLRDRQEEIAKDYLLALNHSALLSHPDLTFSKLLQAQLSPQDELFSMWERLRRLTEIESVCSATVIVDCETFKITNRNNQKENVSEPMVNAIDALKDTGVTSFEKVAAVSFGISRFDPVIHSSKIFNLLTRMKAVFEPAVSFKTKNFKIYAHGDFSQVHFSNTESKTRSLFVYPQWREVVYERMPLVTEPKRQVSISVDLASSLSREQIQKMCEKSRATTGRMIQTWTEKGWIKKIGNSRNTRYRLSSFLQNEIKEGRLLV